MVKTMLNGFSMLKTNGIIDGIDETQLPTNKTRRTPTTIEGEITPIKTPNALDIAITDSVIINGS